MSNLDKALEWANTYTEGGHCPGIDGPWAAAEIIKSLPDQWLDVEKLREIIEEMNEYPEAEYPNDYRQGFNYATRHWREAFESLLTLNELPTLADMTAEEREACKWMQAEVEGFDKGERPVIAMIESPFSVVWEKSGTASVAKNESITPLPGPKLKWPGSEVVEPPALPEGMRLADHPDFGRVVVSPWADDDEEYKVFFRDEDGHAGADSYYARKRNLTFLDGGE